MDEETIFQIITAPVATAAPPIAMAGNMATGAFLWVGDGTKNSGGSHTLESPSANDLGPHGPDMIGHV